MSMGADLSFAAVPNLPHEVRAQLSVEIASLRLEVERIFGAGTRETLAILTSIEDDIQEALTRGIANLHAFQREGGSVKAWIATIAHNLRIDRARAARREAAVLNREENDLDAFPSAQRSPETLAMLREACRHVSDAMARLPPESKRAFLLFHFEDLTHAQIGAILGTTEAAAKMRCARAHEKLVQELGDDVLDLLHSLRCRLPPMFFESRRAEFKRALGLQRTLEMTRRASNVFAAVLATALAFYHVEQIPLAQSGLQMPRIRVEAHADNPAEYDTSPAQAMTTKDMRFPVLVHGASTRAIGAHSAKSASIPADDALLEPSPVKSMYTPSVR